jgi:hypothetical protein
MPKLPLLYRKVQHLLTKEIDGSNFIERDRVMANIPAKFRIEKREMREVLKEMRGIILLDKRKTKIR